MLAFAIFAITFAIFLFVLVLYLYPASRRLTTIPGLEPSDAKDGNLSDITTAGGLHPFLVELHKNYGPISGFWFGEQYVVSLGSPELFKEQLKVFDRPPVLFKYLEPLIGAESIQFANGIDGRQRRKQYDRFFNQSACKKYFDIFYLLGDNMVKKWASFPANEHVPLHQFMMALTLKSILATAFGSSFSEKNLVQFHRLYELIFSELCSRLLSQPFNSENMHDKRILTSIDELHSIVRRVIEERKRAEVKEEEIFIDFLINNGTSDASLLSESVTYVIGGFHTTGNLLTWCLYFLATHKDIQEKVYEELIKVYPDGNLAIETKLNDLKYLNQVINETLRLSVLGPFAARCQDIDVEIGGHIIPRSTPVLHALGVVLTNPDVWPNPAKFDPDRFQQGNEKNRKPLSHCPFGFAGQRICPGQKFAMTEALIYLSAFCYRFKMSLVEGQVVTPVYSLITRPEDEIWITISDRKISAE